MCYQKMCQIGGRKPGRQLPVPVVAGTGQDDLWAAESTAYTKRHYCIRITQLHCMYRSDRKASCWVKVSCLSFSSTGIHLHSSSHEVKLYNSSFFCQKK